MSKLTQVFISLLLRPCRVMQITRGDVSSIDPQRYAYWVGIKMQCTFMTDLILKKKNAFTIFNSTLSTLGFSKHALPISKTGVGTLNAPWLGDLNLLTRTGSTNISSSKVALPGV